VSDALKKCDERYEVFDKDVPGLGVRVSPSGRKAWFLVTRRPGKNPSRVSLGDFPGRP
jgi:Arm DNA-binding domain